VKILAGHDVGGGLRPIFGNVDIFLAEDGDALFIADQRGALFPFDGVERVGAPAVKKRSNTRPARAAELSGALAATDLLCNADFTVAILFLPIGQRL